MYFCVNYIKHQIFFTMYTIIAINNQDPAQEVFERLEVQSVPNEITQSRKSNVATIDVVGRNNPITQTTGGNTTVSLKIDIVARTENKQDVLDKTKWLNALTYKGKNSVYPLVKLVFADMYKKEVWLVENCNITYKNFDQTRNNTPTYATVDLTLQLANEKDLLREEIL
jgi:hypothetical protein